MKMNKKTPIKAVFFSNNIPIFCNFNYCSNNNKADKNTLILDNNNNNFYSDNGYFLLNSVFFNVFGEYFYIFEVSKFMYYRGCSNEIGIFTHTQLLNLSNLSKKTYSFTHTHHPLYYKGVSIN